MTTKTNPFLGIIDQTPDPYFTSARWRVWRNAAKGRIEIQYSRDSGATWKTMLPEPPTNPRSGLTLTITDSGDAEWLDPADNPSLSAIYGTDSGSTLQAGAAISYVDLSLTGVLKEGRTFGIYVAPPTWPIRCFGTQMFLQSPGAGGETQVDLVAESGSEAAKISTLPSGITYKQTMFASPLIMPANSLWRLRIKRIGTDDPGEFLSVRLILSA